MGLCVLESVLSSLGASGSLILKCFKNHSRYTHTVSLSRPGLGEGVEKDQGLKECPVVTVAGGLDNWTRHGAAGL